MQTEGPKGLPATTFTVEGEEGPIVFYETSPGVIFANFVYRGSSWKAVGTKVVDGWDLEVTMYYRHERFRYGYSLKNTDLGAACDIMYQMCKDYLDYYFLPREAL